MDFIYFLDKGEAVKTSKDIILAKSLLSTAKMDLEFLSQLKLNEISARKLVSNYYDILRSILEAHACHEGFKIYSHEAFTYFLKEKKEDAASFEFERYRKIRNRINYYGEIISLSQARECILGIKCLIDKMVKKMPEFCKN